MKALIFAPDSMTLFKFRSELMFRLRNDGYEVVAVGFGDEYEREIVKLGYEYIEVKQKPISVNPINDLALFACYFKIIEKHKPDIVFSYAIKPVVYASIAAKTQKVEGIFALIPGMGSVFSLRGIKGFLLRSICSVLYKTSLFCCDRVFFQNADDESEFIEKRFTSLDKCAITNGSGVNLNEYPVLPLPETPAFIYAGRLLRSKGALDFLAAARVLKREHETVRFLLVGGTHENPDSLKFDDIKEFIADGSAEYFGKVADVRSYIGMSSIFVYPSRYREGVPRAILEAMSMGRAIITTNSVGCKETVECGKNGFLITPGDTDRLIEAMRFMIINPDSSIEMGRESRRIAEEKFDVAKVNEAIMCEINIAIASKHKKRFWQKRNESTV